jgi:hypothetical protein
VKSRAGNQRNSLVGVVAVTPLASLGPLAPLIPLAPLRPLATLGATITTVGPAGLLGLTRVVDSELTAVDHLLLESLLGGHGALNIGEVGVCETPRLTGATVDGDSDVEDVLDLSEEIYMMYVSRVLEERSS